MPIKALSSTALLLTLLLALLLRLPRIDEGIPYFYDQDEAHHYNRIISMTKEGRFNPQYFLKPSFHFYLRMPVVKLAALESKMRGEIKSFADLKTYDRYGLAKYLMSASPPRVLERSRAFSVLLSLLIVVVTYITSRELLRSKNAALYGALVTACAPPLISYSATIGVDTPMALFVLLSTYFAVRLAKQFSDWHLILSCIFAGLAVSTKYNAAPIAALPLLIVALQKRADRKNLLIAAFLPAIVFVGASPFLVLEFGLFLKHIRYEIWHYAVAGHEGHTAERGIPQLLFYAKWCVREALGIPLTILSLLGFFLLLQRAFKNDTLRAQYVSVLFFPVCFGLLMILQRANFTRNMLVMIPFAALFSAVVIDRLRYQAVGLLVAALAFTQPILWTLAENSAIHRLVDTRTQAEMWLKELPSYSESAVAADLQFALSVRTLPGVALALPEQAPESLFNLGFDRMLTPGWRTFSLPVEKNFPGETVDTRMLRSPEINVYILSKLTPPVLPELIFGEGISTGERYQWLSHRATLLKLKESALSGLKEDEELAIEVMTPWKNQTLSIEMGDTKKLVLFDDKEVGSWKTVTIKLPGAAPSTILARISQIHVPAQLGISTDKRRLGVALRIATIATSP